MGLERERKRAHLANRKFVERYSFKKERKKKTATSRFLETFSTPSPCVPPSRADSRSISEKGEKSVWPAL